MKVIGFAQLFNVIHCTLKSSDEKFAIVHYIFHASNCPNSGKFDGGVHTIFIRWDSDKVDHGDAVADGDGAEMVAVSVQAFD